MESGYSSSTTEAVVLVADVESKEERFSFKVSASFKSSRSNSMESSSFFGSSRLRNSLAARRESWLIKTNQERTVSMMSNKESHEYEWSSVMEALDCDKQSDSF